MNNKYSPENTAGTAVSIMAEVIFGAPGRGCAGSGVCKLIPFQKLKNWRSSCPKFQTRIDWYEYGSLSFTLSIAELKSRGQLDEVLSSSFLVEEDFFFPLWFQHKVKHKNTYISSGIYPYMVSDGQIKLFFPWRKAQARSTNRIRDVSETTRKRIRVKTAIR